MNLLYTNQNNCLSCIGKNLFTVLVIVMLALQSYGQSISSYSFSSFTGSPTDIMGQGTLLGSGNQDDNNYSITLPFTFNYHGTNFTTAGISCNGYIVLGGSSSIFYSPLVNLANCISAHGCDLAGYANGHRLEYLTTGTSPNRVFRVQWSDWGHYSTGTNEYTFQIALFETSNAIQINYLAAPGNTAHLAQVGLTGSSVTDFNVRTTTTDWSATTAAMANSANCTYNSTIKPANNLCFQWLEIPGCSTNFTLSTDSSMLHHYWVTATITGTAPFHYLWSWGDNTTDTTAFPSHIYANAGTYTISLSKIVRAHV